MIHFIVSLGKFEPGWKIEIYQGNGFKLYSDKVLNSDTYTAHLNVAHGIYLVKISFSDDSFENHILIKN
jgi:hypothetical protein